MRDLQELHCVETSRSYGFQAAEPSELVQSARDLVGDSKPSNEQRSENGRINSHHGKWHILLVL